MQQISLHLLRWGLNHAIVQWLGFGSAAVLGVGALTFLPIAPAVAADQLVVTYGPLGRSIPIQDLRNLAETGKTTRQLRWYLNVANLDAETLQEVLTKEVQINQQLIDRVTYSLPGEFLLHQAGNTIHTRSERANIQALRAALLLSTSGDNKISLLEFLEQYPTPELYVDGVSIVKLVNDVDRIRDRVEPIVTAVESFLEGLVCDCQQ
ncbi:MAG TPA: alpha/beta hydrolase [Trichocoleus sp.]|jgi:hypothetical protein